MSDNSVPSRAGASGPAEDAANALASALTPPHTPLADEVDGRVRRLRAAVGVWLARLPGERRHWMMGSMMAGGVLLGGLLSGGVAWKMIGSRDAEVLVRTVRLDAQSSQLSQQAELIKVLTRAINERPLPDEPARDAAPASLAGSTTPTAAPATPAPAAPAPAAPSPRSLPARPTAERAPAGVSPGYAGSGICDVPGGSEGRARMRKCIEWFAGRDKGAARATP